MPKKSPFTKNIKDSYYKGQVQKYHDERMAVRQTAIRNTPNKNVALELYAGHGYFTKLYQKSFKQVITVDIDKLCPVFYHISAMDFIKKQLPFTFMNKKIDLVDFDAFGGPHFEIQEFFKAIAKESIPFTLVITDGIGITMKRTRKCRIEERLLTMLPEEVLRYAWKEHPLLTRSFIIALSRNYGLKAKELSLFQGKGKNFVFSSWLIY